MPDHKQRLTFTLKELEEQKLEELRGRALDVVIIGSGPASIAVADFLYTEYPNADFTITILERGNILTTTHISNTETSDPLKSSRGSMSTRGAFIKAHETKPWKGDFEKHGMLMFALGGRSIVAGALLRRFDPDDFKWALGEWPIGSEDLDAYYTRAEVVRGVVQSEWDGPAQVWVLGKLKSKFNVIPSPWGAESKRNNHFANRTYDSPVTRLWSLVLEDHERASNNPEYKRRIFISLDAYVTRLEKNPNSSQIESLICRDARNPENDKEVRLHSKVVVLAASTIESARLVLNSAITANEVTGCYLGDHIYFRTPISVPTPFYHLHDEGANVLIPPKINAPAYRYQIDIRGQMDPDHISNLNLGITGSVATEVDRYNKVTVGHTKDDWGIPKAEVSLKYEVNHTTRSRIENVKQDIEDIQKLLGGKVIAGETLDGEKGRSHHEAGTLRMGESTSNSVTNKYGRFHDIENLYVADASVFPCVGVANPMLTITAWGYRVACAIAKQHFDYQPPTGYSI